MMNRGPGLAQIWPGLVSVKKKKKKKGLILGLFGLGSLKFFNGFIIFGLLHLNYPIEFCLRSILKLLLNTSNLIIKKINVIK
ncbi:hypothetical protein ABN235_19170, partial [Morganella morganii]|uniref:hypothetical protein n=1 Tax=Morganella morganii TaxID=582 RepID=UPI0032D9F8D1